MVTVLFTNGTQKDYDADSSGPNGPLFVLLKYNRKRRKTEICQTFPLETVVWARSDETIVVGGGRLEREPQ